MEAPMRTTLNIDEALLADFKQILFLYLPAHAHWQVQEEDHGDGQNAHAQAGDHGGTLDAGPAVLAAGLDLGAQLLDLGGELADAAADQRETPDDAQGLARVLDGGAGLDDVGTELRLGADVVPDEHPERHPHHDPHDDADIDPAHRARAEQLRVASHGPSSWSRLLYPATAPARAICSRRTTWVTAAPPMSRMTLFIVPPVPVSYTHLRAHETRH